MIVIDPDDGAKVLSFEDWTCEMIQLSSALWDLPPRPDHTGPATHENGVDQLARMSRGELAMDLLYDYAGELDYRPDEDEVIRLGLRLVELDLDLNGVRRRYGEARLIEMNAIRARKRAARRAGRLAH